MNDRLMGVRFDRPTETGDEGESNEAYIKKRRGQHHVRFRY